MDRFKKVAISIAITVIFAGLFVCLAYYTERTSKRDVKIYESVSETALETSVSGNNRGADIKHVADTISDNDYIEDEHTEDDPRIGPNGVKAHYPDIDKFEEECKDAYERRCRRYNLDMSDYSKYNDRSEISAEGESWEEAYLALIDEYVGYTVSKFIYDYPDASEKWLFSLLYLNDDKIPELEIGCWIPNGEVADNIYSFDGEKTVYCDLPLGSDSFVSTDLYKDFILKFYHGHGMAVDRGYYFYNINKDMSYEEGMSLREYMPWIEEDRTYEEEMHYSVSSGPDSEEREISEEEFLSFFEKMGVDPYDPDKSTAPEPENIFSGDFDEIMDYLLQRSFEQVSALDKLGISDWRASCVKYLVKKKNNGFDLKKQSSA